MKEVFSLLFLHDPQIAKVTGLRKRTVERHIQRLHTAYRTRTRVALVYAGMQDGLHINWGMLEAAWLIEIGETKWVEMEELEAAQQDNRMPM